jgi:hypothetical protein
MSGIGGFETVPGKPYTPLPCGRTTRRPACHYSGLLTRPVERDESSPLNTGNSRVIERACQRVGNAPFAPHRPLPRGGRGRLADGALARALACRSRVGTAPWWKVP